MCEYSQVGGWVQEGRAPRPGVGRYTCVGGCAGVDVGACVGVVRAAAGRWLAADRRSWPALGPGGTSRSAPAAGFLGLKTHTHIHECVHGASSSQDTGCGSCFTVNTDKSRGTEDAL